jgi:AcrR family transcriptional regulator
MSTRRRAPEVRRDEILRAAEALLKRDGSKVRVEDVVRVAGIAKGTFYLYFPTWDDLLASLRSNAAAAFVRKHPMPAPHEGVDWMALLNAQVGAFIDATLSMGKLHEELYHSDFAVRCPPPAEEDAVQRFIEIISEGQRAGAFAGFDTVPVAKLLFAAIHRSVDEIAAGEHRAAAVAALERVLEAVLIPHGGTR